MAFVEVGEGGVRPGWGLRRLAAAAQSNIAALVRPGLEALFEHTRESVDLSTGHGREVAFLDRIISDQELRVVPIADRPRPLHAMANGKGTRGRFVTSRIGTAQESEVMANTLNRPDRSVQRPTRFMLKTVNRPPKT